jgi:hypothetical protein
MSCFPSSELFTFLLLGTFDALLRLTAGWDSIAGGRAVLTALARTSLGMEREQEAKSGLFESSPSH